MSIVQNDEALTDLLATFTTVDDMQMEHQHDFRSDAAVVERARKYLAKLPIAVSGENGSAKCFHAACVLVKGFELPSSDAMELLKEYSSMCQPPWSEHELHHKIDDACRAKGESGYLRNAKMERWEEIAVPKYKAPKPQPKPVEKKTLRGAVEKAIEHSRGARGHLIDLGIPELNRAIGGGAEFGEMVLIAARPSHGKSAVALQMISAMTANGIRCAFFSEEMSELVIGKRVLQFAQSIPFDAVDQHAAIVKHKVDEYFGLRQECVIFENCRTVENVCEQIRAAVRDDGVKAVIVDYVQLLQSSGSRYETVTANSVALRQVCSETGVLMIALAQMSRAIESRDSFIPKTSDLKESGQLEQDADVILFLVWPWKLNPEKERSEYHMYVAKNRNREIVSHFVPCRFDAGRQRVTASTVSTEISDYKF